MMTEVRKDPTQGKLAPNWEGSFRIVKNLQNGAYRLETLDEKAISRTLMEIKKEEDFTNGGRDHPPKHLKFFLLVF